MRGACSYDRWTDEFEFEGKSPQNQTRTPKVRNHHVFHLQECGANQTIGHEDDIEEESHHQSSQFNHTIDLLTTTMEHKQDVRHKEPRRIQTSEPPTPSVEEGEEDVSFFHDFIAGGVAGSASVVVGHPFDTIKVSQLMV